MKIPNWLLNLVIILMIIIRLILPLLIFREFFYFRMINVMCLFLTFLILDSVEGVITFYRGLLWSKGKKIIAHIANFLLIFAIVSILLLRHGFISHLGYDIQPNQIVNYWLIITGIIFVLILILSYFTRDAWGDIQYLLAQLTFLLYCFWYVPWWAIILGFVSAICFILTECLKHNFNLKEMRKKDPRFR